MKKASLLFVLLVLASIFFQAQNLVPTDKLALLKGNVTNFAGKILSKEIIVFVNESNKSSYNAVTDAKGDFEILIPVNATYTLKYKTFTSDMEYTKMQVPADKEATYNVKIKIDPPREFILKDVFFDTGKSAIKQASFKTLNDLTEILKIKNTMVIEIQGHTDNVGSEEDNVKLSEARAAEVRKYLISKGIEAARVNFKGFGSQHPITDNNNEEGRAKNRRTELKVIER